MAEGAKKVPAPGRRAAADLKQLQQLVEMQRQIVQIARQNDEARRHCARLRSELTRDVTRSFPERRAVALLARLQAAARRILRGSPDGNGSGFEFQPPSVRSNR